MASELVYDIGDYVEITQNRRGTIKYEGNIKFVGYIIGLELDDQIPGGTDGTLLGVRYFKCPKGKATFVKTSKIKQIIKPKYGNIKDNKNRIRKALNLPTDDDENERIKKRKSKKKSKRQRLKKKKKKSKSKVSKSLNKKKSNNSSKPQQSQSMKKSPATKKKTKKSIPKIPSLSTNDGDSDNSSTGSSNSGSSGSKGDLAEPKASLSSLSKRKTKAKRKEEIRKRSDDTTMASYTHNSSASPAQPPPRTPRPRNNMRRRATSSLKLSKKDREKYMNASTRRKQGSGSSSTRRKGKGFKDDQKEQELVKNDVNENLKYQLKVLSTLSPLRKRQEALKQCIAILNDKKLTKSGRGSSVFSFGAEKEEKGDVLDSLTLKYFMESFKKPFMKQIEDKRVSIQKDVIALLHAICKNHWLYIKQYITYYMKKILIYFEKNDIKSTRKLIEPTIKLIIKSLKFGDDKVIVVKIIAELIQFASKSRSKLVKKHSWIYVGLMVKKQIKYQQELPSASSSPSYAIDNTNKRGRNRSRSTKSSSKQYSFQHQPQQNMFDLLQSGLKKGISDSDKSTQSEAMGVLTLFSILDETRAERLISRMSGTTMRQYRKYNESSGNHLHHKKYSLSSPRASLTMMSPKNNALVSPRSKSLSSPTQRRNSSRSPKTAFARVSLSKLSKQRSKKKSAKKKDNNKSKTKKKDKDKNVSKSTPPKKKKKPPISIPSVNTTEATEIVEVVTAGNDDESSVIAIEEPKPTKKATGSGGKKGGGFSFAGLSLDTSRKESDDGDGFVMVANQDDAKSPDNVMSDEMSSTDTEDDSFSGDSGDSDDDNGKSNKRKKSSISMGLGIPSINTGNSNEDGTKRGNGRGMDNGDGDSDGSGSESDGDSDDDEKAHSGYDQGSPFGKGKKGGFKIVSTKPKKKGPFKMPTLNTAMSKSATIYDRNTNIKPKTEGKKRAMPGLARPSSAKFGSTSQLDRGSSRNNGDGMRRGGNSASRPSSARASGGDKKMSFILDSEDETDDDDIMLPASPSTPNSVNSESSTDSDSDFDSSDDDLDDDDDMNIGLSAGPQKDLNTFRQNVNNGYMPKTAQITYNGLLNEYYFDTKENRRNFEGNDDEKDSQSLFYPSYCYGRVNTMKILQSLPYPALYDSDESEYDDTEDEEDEDFKKDEGKNKKLEHYLTIGLNSNVNEKSFKRNQLNLVILLDQSGSMGSTFNNDTGKSKMMIANECLCSLLDQLNDDDRFALISFDNEIFIHTESKLELMKNIDKDGLKQKIMSIKENGGTNFELAYEKSNEFYDDLFNSSKDFETLNQGYDNRVIMLTDACPNVGATDPHSLLHLFRKNCSSSEEEYKRIYTTFVGVGLDFNTEMVAEISKHRGCNYYSVKSAEDFQQTLNDEFEYMVTPLVFNVSLTLKSEGDQTCISDIYGMNDKKRRAIKSSGEIQHIGTLFPSKRDKTTGSTKGGVVIVKLKTKRKKRSIDSNDFNNDDYNIKMEIKYEDRDGKLYQNEKLVTLNVNETKGQYDRNQEAYFDNVGIRKGILLCRYCTLIKQWIDEQMDSNHARSFLNVSETWKTIFSDLIIYFQKEMEIIQDPSLQKEVDLLNKLVEYTQQINKTKPSKSRFSFNTSDQISPLRSVTSTSTSPTTSVSSADPSSPRTQQNDIMDLIVSFLELKDPRITWKMIEFLSNEPTTNIFMSFLSRMAIEEKIWVANLDKDINYNRSIPDTSDLHSEDSNEIRLTQLSYSLMRILSNDNYAETVKSFLSRKCHQITLHSLAVFHPFSSGNAYHGRVVLESLLTSTPKELFQCLGTKPSIKKLLKCALLRNIHEGNMNSFFLDLICYRSQSRQKLYKQQTELHHKNLLKMLSGWNLVPYILEQCHSYKNNDNVSTKFSTFFIDLTARSASIQGCSVLFKEEYATLIVDELVGKGLLDTDKKRSTWTRVQCAQTLIQFLDICSRPTILDPSQMNNTGGGIGANMELEDHPNILYSLFEPLLERLHSYMPQLANLVINFDGELKPIATTHGIIDKPFGQIRLNCLELLTVGADFAQFDCGNALAKIPMDFFRGLLELAFVHKTNNFFLVHFRRLIHLSMIFRRRILKELFLEQDMLIKFINYYNKESIHSDLSAYIVQMLFDFYDHDKLALEREEQKLARLAAKEKEQQEQTNDEAPVKESRHKPVASSASSLESYDSQEDEDEEDQDELRANFSDEPEDQWSIAKYFDSSELWQKFKSTVIEEIDAQATIAHDVPNWEMGQSSNLEHLISSLLRTEDEDDGDQEPFRDKINSGLMPSLSSVSYYSVLNEYEFFNKTKNNNEYTQRLLSNIDNDSVLCYPSFSFAKSKIPQVLVRAHDDDEEHNNDEKDDLPQHFMTIDLNMNNIEKRERNKLNLVIVLDQSESMGHYWHDDTENEENQKMKIDFAIEGITNILNTLNDDDRIGIITFDQEINCYQQLDQVSGIDANELLDNLEKICEKLAISSTSTNEEHPSVMKSGINFESAFNSATSLFENLFDSFKDDLNEYDNRIIFLSDYVPQSMSFVNLIKNCSEDINERICASFISIGGCEYNSIFINQLLRNRGCNYQCPKSPKVFVDKITKNKNGEFDEIVTPLIYDLCLNIKSSDKSKQNTINCFNHIYGIKNEKKQKSIIQCGEIYKNYTLFLSHRSKTNGIILIELNNALLEEEDQSFSVKIEMSFEDRDGRWYEHSQKVVLKCEEDTKEDQDYFDNVQIRKSILIHRYIKIIKQRIEDDPKISDSNSIELTKWKSKLKKFIEYFKYEMIECDDIKLKNELTVLQKLCDFSD